jgi:hypothetical protein
MSNEYVRCTEDSLFIPNDATKRTFSSLFAELQADGLDVEKIK